jgi:hypothetical protein
MNLALAAHHTPFNHTDFYFAFIRVDFRSYILFLAPSPSVLTYCSLRHRLPFLHIVPYAIAFHPTYLQINHHMFCSFADCAAVDVA